MKNKGMEMNIEDYIKTIEKVKTAEHARQIAIDWQQWVSEQNEIGKEPTLYQSDLVEWGEYFRVLASKFDLEEEFRENGII